MVEIIPENSFSSRLGAALGSGIQQGIGKAADFAAQMAMEKAKVNSALKTYQALRGASQNKQPFSSELKGQKETQKYDPYEVAQVLEAHGLHGAANIEKTRAEQEQKHLYRIQEEEAKEQRARGSKLLEKRDLSRETLLQRRADYDIAEQTILQNPKDIGSLKNFASEAFKLPQLKTAPAAAFSSAMKDAFVNSIRAIPGARPNQWVEQQVQQAMARIGQSDEANLSALAVGKYKIELEEAENQIIDEIEEELKSKGEKFTGEASKELYYRLKPVAEEKQFELAYKLKELQEKELGEKELRKRVFKSVPKGTPLTPQMAQILLEEAGNDEEKALKAAKKLGYIIPTDEQLLKFGYSFE